MSRSIGCGLFLAATLFAFFCVGKLLGYFGKFGADDLPNDVKIDAKVMMD